MCLFLAAARFRLFVLTVTDCSSGSSERVQRVSAPPLLLRPNETQTLFQVHNQLLAKSTRGESVRHMTAACLYARQNPCESAADAALIFDELPDGAVEPLITVANIDQCVCVCDRGIPRIKEAKRHGGHMSSAHRTHQ